MESGEIHPGQSFLDNLGLQLAASLGWTIVSYLVWGFIDIINTPPFSG